MQAPTSPASLQRTCDDYGCDVPARGVLLRMTCGRKRNKRRAFRELVRHTVWRVDTIFDEIRPCSSSMNSRISSKSSGVKTSFNTTDITWRRVSSVDCRNMLTNTAAWPSTVLGDGTRRLARRASPLWTKKDSTERIHDVFCYVLGQCRCQSAWMDGWMVQRRVLVRVWMRTCPLLHEIPTIWSISDKHTNASSHTVS